MTLYRAEKYLEDIDRVAELELDWSYFDGKTFLISGATGLLGSFIIDVLLCRKRHYGLNSEILAIGRSKEKARSRFSEYLAEIKFVCADLNDGLSVLRGERADIVLHLASNTHPVAYATEPIDTIRTNIVGHMHMLDFATEHGAEKYLFASSCEVYGENRGDTELFSEDYCGYIDPNTLRAGYPESKRCGEALCQAYMKEKGLPVFIPRLSRTYGPTMLMSDSKALSQFIKKGLAGEDIVLKSEGMQYYSYTYVADAVSALLTVLLCGEPGKAYNVADTESDIRLKDLAGLVAKKTGRKVVFELPEEMERLGYSKATKSRLDGAAIRALGWRPSETIESGIVRTLDILKNCRREAEIC